MSYPVTGSRYFLGRSKLPCVARYRRRAATFSFQGNSPGGVMRSGVAGAGGGAVGGGASISSSSSGSSSIAVEVVVVVLNTTGQFMSDTKFMAAAASSNLDSKRKSPCPKSHSTLAGRSSSATPSHNGVALKRDKTCAPAAQRSSTGYTFKKVSGCWKISAVSVFTGVICFRFLRLTVLGVSTASSVASCVTAVTEIALFAFGTGTGDLDLDRLELL
mmetsp:Transcript_31374/g.65495  ORF Transcript_31374/g.65495 Transcript_31374/m.65495 type:complete len:217 (-) Transcript_31374:1615-2265(-)